MKNVLLILASSEALSLMEKFQAIPTVGDGNPQALKLTPGSYLNTFPYAAMYAPNAVSVSSSFGSISLSALVSLLLVPHGGGR